MNKFGSSQMRPLIDGLRKRASAVYLATDEVVAKDLAEALNDAADSLEAADSYYLSVEAAMI